MADVRVRFAPSPTGFLHIGGARTALHNWLFARHEGGTFVLRIEDTDRARSTVEYLDAIMEDLRWLGLDWDEGPLVGGESGPYLQSERGATYAPHVGRLLSAGLAYHCFCTPEEIEARRRGAPDGGRDWRYDRKCLALSEGKVASLLSGGRPAAVRFRIPEGTTSFTDLVLGAVAVDNAQLDDLVIVRPDGTPTYNFAAVVDDASMAITHVIRGGDHLSNTPKQILMFRALNHEPPRFGHLPLVLAQDGHVLSKRRGAVSVGEYRRRGYVPEALVNYMALLGWAYDGAQEIFSLSGLVEKFEMGRVSKKAAMFDPDKLGWMNAQWIKSLSIEERASRVVPYLVAEGLLPGDITREDRAHLESVVGVVGDRLKTLADIVEQGGFFLAPDVVYDKMAVSKVLSKPGAAETLEALANLLRDVPDFEPATLEEAIRGFAKERGLSAGKVIQPVRVAVTGGTASPGIFETLSVLGRSKVLDRLEGARDLAG